MTEDRLPEILSEWYQDCLQCQGQILKGRYSHWCYDWDGLPVDETCEEFKHGCTCFEKHELMDEKFMTRIKKRMIE